MGEAPGRPATVIALDEALARLSGADERKSKLVEMRYFGGMTAEEIAECTNISVNLVRRELRLAQAWLLKELSA
jgi:RNA polymerase sigma factor (sigma-70 family)